MNSECCNATIRIACGNKSFALDEEKKINNDDRYRGKTYYYWCTKCEEACHAKVEE